MKPAQLLAHFDRVSEAPDSIPCLRQFILELAVRGKLVDHDPKDEPASALLKRILAERERRIRDEQMTTQEPLAQVRPDEARFDIPASWSWVRLGTITQVLMGQSPPGETYNKTGEGIPLINGPVEFTEGPFGKTVVNQYTTAPTNLCEEGDLLLCVRGSTTGRTNIAGFRACIGRGVAAIRPFFADQYVRLFIWRLRASIIAMGRGIAFPSVSRQQIEELPVPLPPFTEQHRIVAKVDELMALCDRLEAAQAERENRRNRLAAASLHRLNNGADAGSFRTHVRFHLRHLPRLTTRIEHIKQLRQTILNLAVRGKLVPQDLNDEPASKLIARIQSEKGRRTKTRRMMREPQLPPIDEDNAPFELPSGWVWARFPELGIFGRGKSKHRPRNDPSLFEGGTHLLVQTGDVARSNGFIKTFTGKYNEVGLAQSEKWPKGTLCVTIAANIADSGILSFDACFPDSVVGFIPSLPFENASYFEYFVRTAKGGLLQFAPATAQKNINLGILNEVLIPIPPLAEQDRIVAKVDELMGICDRLESQIRTTQTESHGLLEATLHRALSDQLESDSDAHF